MKSVIISMNAYATNGSSYIYPLEDALEDAYIGLLMTEAFHIPYQTIHSAKRPWKS